MNLKTIVLLLTVLSLIRNNNDVQCTVSINSYLTLMDFNHIEAFNLKCHNVIYTIISNELYKLKRINNEATICYPDDGDECDTKLSNDSLGKLFGSYTALRRLNFKLDNSKLKVVKNECHTFFVEFYEWSIVMDSDKSRSTNQLQKFANTLIKNGTSENIFTNFSNRSHHENVMETYKYCEKTLSQMSTPSIDYMKDYILGELVTYRTRNYLDYGYILLLLKKEELDDLKRMKMIHDKKFVVILGLMKDALANILYGMCRVLRKIEFDDKNTESFNEIETETHRMKLELLISMYPRVIDVAKIIYNMSDDSDSYYTNQKKKLERTRLHTMETQGSQDTQETQETNQFNEYNKFVIYFSLKLMRMTCEPSVHTLYIKNSRYKLTDLHLKKGTPEDYLTNVEFNNYIDRLTVDKNNELKVTIPVYGYYGIFHEDKKEFIEPSDKEIIFILELNVWIILLKKYAEQMKYNEYNVSDIKKDQNYASVVKSRPLFDIDKLLLSQNEKEMTKIIKNQRDRILYNTKDFKEQKKKRKIEREIKKNEILIIDQNI